MVETFFTEKRIIKKIIIAIVFVFIFNFAFCHLGNNIVFAEKSYDDVKEGEALSDSQMEESGGGKLLLPIHNLVLFIADAVLEVMQNSFISQDPVTITATSDDTKKVNGWAIAGIVIGAVVLAVACVVTYGAAAAAVGTVTSAVAGTTGAAAIGTAATAIGAAAATYGGTVVGGLVFAGGAIAGIAYSTDTLIDDIKGEYDLPTIQYTPEAIFSNRIPLFNIDFFNPVEATVMEYKFEKGNLIKEEEKTDNTEVANGIENFTKWINTLGYSDSTVIERTEVENLTGTTGELVKGNKKPYTYTIELRASWTTWEKTYEAIYRHHYDNGIRKVETKVKNPKGVGYHTKTEYKKTNEEINETKCIIKEYETKKIATKTIDSSSDILQNTVASMYKTLRSVAIVALLTILVYVGIRMVLSSASKDKAKYKQMLMDWLVALILLFVLHYMMAFIIEISENLTGICNKSNIENVPIRIPNGTKLKNEKGEFSERLDGGDEGADIWGTNFIGAIRFYAGLVQNKGYTIKGISYTLMYIVLVIYMVMFTFQYLKRVLYMAFLTMIAPLVAITYPLDKISDGKAQGFNMWLKEYIFNALLQPIHYIIYIIIMGSVMDMVIDHPVYALVALGFMIPAEKFIRKMFGFEKASTVGTFGAAAGAAALMSGLQRLRHKPHGRGNDDNGAKGDKDNPNGKIRSISAMPDGPDNPPTGGLPGGNNVPRPGEPGFIGPLPYNENTTLLGMPQQNTNNERYGQNQYDRLTADYEDTQTRVSNALGDDTPRPGEPGFIGPLPYDENATLATMPQEPTINLMDYATNNRQRVYGPMPYDSNTTLATMPRTNQKPNLFNRARGTARRIGNSSFGQGVRAVGGHYKRRLDNRLRKAHPLRAIRRGLTFGIGAATLGTIGLAAGIASGDPSKALQFTAAGAMAGGHLGQNLGETASNVIGLEGATKAFKAGVLGSKYDELERAKYKRDFKNNVTNYDAGVKNVTAKGWKEMSKDGGIIDTALDYGINNVDDMSNIYKTQQKFINDNGLSEEEAQDLAFKAYKLDQQFGDYSSNSKTQENLDKLLKAKGWTDDTQREQIKEGMLNTMKAYQKVSLDEDIEEPRFDYTRMANSNTEETEPTNDQGPLRPNLNLFGHEEVDNNGNSTESQEDKNREEDKYNQEQQIPTTNVQKENTEEVARRANAEHEANKNRMEQERKERELQETLEKNAKVAKKGEKRKRAEEARAKNEQAKKKRENMKKENNAEDGQQGESVKEFKSGRKSQYKPRATNNPISSDPGNNGNGPINTL